MPGAERYFTGSMTSGWLLSTDHHQVVPDFMVPTPTKSGGARYQPGGISGGGGGMTTPRWTPLGLCGS
jgi:hypothetical protein